MEMQGWVGDKAMDLSANRKYFGKRKGQGQSVS